MGTDFTANFDLETVEKPSSTFRLAQTVPTSTVDRQTDCVKELARSTISSCTTSTRASCRLLLMCLLVSAGY